LQDASTCCSFVRKYLRKICEQDRRKYPEDTGEIFAAAVYALLRGSKNPPFMKTAGDQQRFG
jgi:hypothetical protein